jgi:hypothetical protein
VNVYYKLAQDYFRHMEGWHLYPGPREPWMWAWTVLAFGWVASLVWLFQKVPSIFSWQFAVVITLLVLLMLVADEVSNRKRAALFGVPTGRKVSASDLEMFRSKRLCEILVVPPDKCLQVANEISGLIDMRKKFRRPDEIDWVLIVRKFYDPDSKQRVLAVVLAGLTVLAALTLKIADATTIFEALESQDVHQFLGGVLSIAAVVFVMSIGLQVLSAVLWNVVIIWIAKSLKTPFSDDAALRYLVRDLLLLYRPSDLETAAQTTAISPSQQPVADSIIREREDRLAA